MARPGRKPSRPRTRCLHHPYDRREVLEDGRVRCLECFSVFKPRLKPAEHGTYNGYTWHTIVRRGEWAFPIPGSDPCGCAQAAREYRRRYFDTPEARAAGTTRSSARHAAMHRLTWLFPSAYRRMYVEEMTRRQLPTRKLEHRTPAWDDLVARLVKAALDRDEESVADRVRLAEASPRELEVHRLAVRLRLVLLDLSRKGEQDE